MATILITGGGRGLGKATAEKLASVGHRVLLTARTQAKADAAVRDIRTRQPHATLEPYAADLASFASIRSLADRVLADGVALDVLFNVAGVMQTNPQRELSADGVELTLAVNALAPFLLTRLLVPALHRTSAARVINVSSRLHLPDSRGKPVDFDFADPNLEHGYNPERAYKNSKLAILWFTLEAQRRLGSDRLTFNAVCPGFVPVTAAESSRKPFQRWLLRHVLPVMPFATSVADATDALAFMATDGDVGQRGGRFFGEKREIEASADARDVGKAAQFWMLASQMTSLEA